MGIGNTNSNIFRENERKIESDTNHANLIPESDSDLLYNSIVKLVIKNKIYGTGFFMKVKIKKTQKNLLLTCNHLANEESIDLKEVIEIFYGKINQEVNIKIKLDKNERYIKTYDSPIDITLIEILDTDNIPESKYLFPDYNYKNGFDFYKNKNFYMAGYPFIGVNKRERAISSGKILDVNNYEFEHSLDSRACSSGSPICSIENKCVVGIHKQGDIKRPINYGTFIGIILDDLELLENKEYKKENDFSFSNIMEKDYIINTQVIENLLIFENEKLGEINKFIIVKSFKEICIYNMKTKQLKFTIQLKPIDIDANEYRKEYSDKLEIVNKRYYKNCNYNINNTDILLITSKFIVAINLDSNKGRILDYIKKEKYLNLLKNINKSDEIYEINYISNLDVFIEGRNNLYFYRNNSLYSKYDGEDFDYRTKGNNNEVNGKFFIFYFYYRNCSTTTVFDMNNNYKKIYQKKYFHLFNSFIKDKYIIFPPTESFDGDEHHPFTFVNLENFSERKIDMDDFSYKQKAL